jgi:hypothetical protein
MTISLYEIDLSQLMGGETFTVQCSLTYNGTYVDYISALPDSGANGFAFLDTSCAKDVMKFLGCEAICLDRPIIAKGYNGVRGHPITHYVLIDLVIDRRRLVEIPFLILDLGNHDMILGAKWMAYFDIQPDLKRRKLVWPASLPQTSEQSFMRKIRVTRESLKPQPIQLEHQLDIERWQRIFDHDETRGSAGKNSGRISQILLRRQPPLAQNTEPVTDSLPPDSWFTDSHEPDTDPQPLVTNTQPTSSPDDQVTDTTPPVIVRYGASYNRKIAKDIAAMEASFQIAEIESLRDNQWYEDERLTKLAEKLRYERRRQAQDPSFLPGPSALDICEVSAVAFHLNLRRKDNELFSISIYEIDRELQAREAKITDEEWTEIMEKLPASYRPYLEDFSKAASNILPPHRPYDHKIELEAD